MTWWARFMAGIGDWYPGGVLGALLTLLVLSLIVGLVLQPRGFFAGLRPSHSVKASTEGTAEIDDGDDVLPELPVDALLERALAYQAAGDYRMAVREWLRVMVRDLVDRGIVEHRPGWTVSELAGAAGTAVPQISEQLREAASWFSEIWYGDRTATIEAGSRMRQLQGEVAASITHHQPVSTTRVEGA